MNEALKSQIDAFAPVFAQLTLDAQKTYDKSLDSAHEAAVASIKS
jgi:hypothetical protein